MNDIWTCLMMRTAWMCMYYIVRGGSCSILYVHIYIHAFFGKELAVVSQLLSGFLSSIYFMYWFFMFFLGVSCQITYHQVTCLVLFYLSVSFETWSGTFLYALAWAEWPLMLFGEPWIPWTSLCFFLSCHVMSPCGFGTWKFFVGPYTIVYQKHLK